MKNKTMFAAALTALLLAACHQPQTILTTHHTDTIQLYTVKHDSIDRYHTHYILQQGDTVHIIDTFYTDRYRTLYRDSIHIVHDTCFQTITTHTESPPSIKQKLTIITLSVLLVISIVIALFQTLKRR